MTHGSAGIEKRLRALREHSDAQRASAHDAAEKAHEELLAEVARQDAEGAIHPPDPPDQHSPT